MASSTTQAIATRIPNELADHLRREADRDGTTVSAVARQCIRLALTGNPSQDTMTTSAITPASALSTLSRHSHEQHSSHRNSIHRIGVGREQTSGTLSVHGAVAISPPEVKKLSPRGQKPAEGGNPARGGGVR
jgi:hypothetical protein